MRHSAHERKPFTNLETLNVIDLDMQNVTLHVLVSLGCHHMRSQAPVGHLGTTGGFLWTAAGRRSTLTPFPQR